MTRRMSAFAILTTLALAFSGSYALAGIGMHVQAAIEHAQEAIDDGAKGDSKEIVTHMMSALGQCARGAARKGHRTGPRRQQAAASRDQASALGRNTRPVWRLGARRHARDERARRTEEDSSAASRDAAGTHGGDMVVAR
ncbi:MAG: small metal-binding protein SmbP [Methylocystis sp.]|uniref:small metal-binding protein SmbP n=1 Tax=Methylocystis sp. TaxID=1911079 RepID=UPI003DA4A491